jgi:hypothetical protein
MIIIEAVKALLPSGGTSSQSAAMVLETTAAAA